MATAQKQNRSESNEQNQNQNQPMGNKGRQFSSDDDRSKEDLIGEQPIRMGQGSEDLDEEDEDLSTSGNIGNRRSDESRNGVRGH